MFPIRFWAEVLLEKLATIPIYVNILVRWGGSTPPHIASPIFNKIPEVKVSTINSGYRCLLNNGDFNVISK